MTPTLACWLCIVAVLLMVLAAIQGMLWTTVGAGILAIAFFYAAIWPDDIEGEH